MSTPPKKKTIKVVVTGTFTFNFDESTMESSIKRHAAHLDKVGRSGESWLKSIHGESLRFHDLDGGRERFPACVYPRFRQYEYRPQDDCIALKSAFKSGGEQHVDDGSGDASGTPEPCAALVGFVEGAWVANFSNPDRPLIARVKDAYEFSGEALLDLVLYRRANRRRFAPSGLSAGLGAGG